MQVVLDAPMIPQCFSIIASTGFFAADEETDLRRGLIVHRSLTATHANNTQVSPGIVIANPPGIANDGITTLFPPPVASFLRDIGVVVEADEVRFTGLLETVLQIGEQLLLIALDGQEVMAPFGPNLGGDLLLAAHGID